jgi:hypothetical protein
VLTYTCIYLPFLIYARCECSSIPPKAFDFGYCSIVEHVSVTASVPRAVVSVKASAAIKIIFAFPDRVLTGCIRTAHINLCIVSVVANQPALECNHLVKRRIRSPATGRLFVRISEVFN